VDLVVLSEVRWGYFRTRKQFLLSRFPEPWRIFFAQPPAAGADDPWTPRREGNVTYFTVPFLKPGTTSPLYEALTGLAPGRALIETWAGRHLRSRLRALGVDPEPVVMTSNIYAAGALSRLPNKLVVYDFNDSPFQFSRVPGWAGPYWQRTLGEVDALFVVSEYYRRQLATQTGKPLILLGNGVEYEAFAGPREAPADLAGLPRPLIGYIGLLSHFLDFEVLEALRRNRRGGTLVLIGPGSPATAQAVAALAGMEGVAVLGPRPYEQVPAYAQALDVGVIPFRANDPFVQGINPNKVYQYLAAGLPLITTPILELTPRLPHIQFASDTPQWTAALDAALDAPRDRDGARALARPHDWGALALRMAAEIEQRVTARG
jgi:teichuronic acid biosynthesis glycosyltransferase TuaH